MIEKVFESNAELKGQRLDIFLASQLPDYSRSQLQQMIRDGKVLCNGKVMDLPRFALREHSVITIQLEEKVEVQTLEAEDFNYEILFEDDSILVINKPAGAVVHPGAGNQTGTIVNALISRIRTLPVVLLLPKIRKFSLKCQKFLLNAAVKNIILLLCTEFFRAGAVLLTISSADIR